MKTKAKSTSPVEPAAKVTKAKKAVSAKASTKAIADAAPKTPRAVAPKKTAAKKSVTPSSAGEVILVAQVDVGLGNTLYFRGWGGGLRWDAGVPAVCEGGNRWVLKLDQVKEPVHFKVLINDDIWNDGPDLTVQPSGALEFSPAFGS
jgi:hypothetical protein